MQEIKDPKKTPGPKNVIYYYIISLVVIMLLNALLFPAVVKNQVIEVPYNQFLEMVDQGSVKQVALDETNSELVFTTGYRQRCEIL
jgi:cell division protease FtsH